MQKKSNLEVSRLVQCKSNQFSKNGKIHNGKQNYKCKHSGRQFVENSTKKYVSEETKKLIERLLLEKISLAGIARVTDVSEKWLQDYVNDKYSKISRKIKVSQKPKGTLTIQCDEAWSFVEHKGNKQWIWLALDVRTREIVGCFVGERGEEGAKGLWNSLPGVYRQCALCLHRFLGSLCYRFSLLSSSSCG